MPVTLKELEQTYKLACNKKEDCKKYVTENFEGTIQINITQFNKNLKNLRLEGIDDFHKIVKFIQTKSVKVKRKMAEENFALTTES